MQSRTLRAAFALLPSAILALSACTSNPTAPVPPSESATSAEIRRINPPNLESAHLGERILCYRPMRHGSPNLSVKQAGNQTIAHDYGHGGSGWTLAPGSVKYVVDLAERTPQVQARRKDEPVAVVGAGVIGLFTAYELVQRGYTNITVVAERFDRLTSHNAGGLIAPVSMDNDPAMQALVNQIGIDAYRFFASIAKGDVPEFRGGAVVVPAYFERRDDSGLEPYVGVVMKPAKDVVLDFGNGTRRNMVAYDDAIFVDTAVMMERLTEWLRPRVRFEQRKVDRFSDLPATLVFDCAGLGSGALNTDGAMVSVQGHLIMLKDQRPEDLQHMILVYFDEGKTEAGQKVKRSFYIFPKQLPGSGPNDIGVVGGTFVEGATPETPNTAEFERMLDGAKRFYGM
jgi:hypothetical protein